MGKQAHGLGSRHADFFYSQFLNSDDGNDPKKLKQNLDGTVAASLPGFAEAPSGEKNGKLGTSEVFAYLFNDLTRHAPSIEAHFGKLGLDLSWMQADSAAPFRARVQAELLGTNTERPEKSLAALVSRKSIDLQDPNGPERLVRAALQSTELSLLPLADQQDLLGRFAESYPDQKSALLAEWKTQSTAYNTLPRLVAQAAMLRGIELDTEAVQLKDLGQDAAARLVKKSARDLFQAAVELDPENPRARRRLASCLFAEGRKQDAGLQLKKSIQCESELEDILHVVTQMKQVSGSGFFLGYSDAWSFAAGALSEAKQYTLAAEVWHAAAREASDAGYHATSLRLTRKELEARELQEPYRLDFDRKVNPVAAKLYECFRAAGIPSAEIDRAEEGREADHVIREAEILAYWDRNPDAPESKTALAALGFVTPPWLDASGQLLPEFRQPGFDGKPLSQKLSATERQAAERSSGKELSHHLRFALALDPANPELMHKLGLHRLSQGKFAAARQVLEQAVTLEPKDSAAWLALAKAELALGDVAAAQASASALLALEPHNLEGLQARSTAAMKLLESIAAPEGDKNSAALIAELRADKALATALGETSERATLDTVAAKLDDPAFADDLPVLREMLATLGKQYLSLSGALQAKAEDSAMVSERMSGLAERTFQILAEDAERRQSPEAKLFQGYRLLAQGKMDAAEQTLQTVRADFPEADALLTQFENDRLRGVNLHALEVWKVYNQEGESILDDKAHGVIGTGIGLIESAFRDDGKSFHDDRAATWAVERRLVATIEQHIQSGKALTMAAALEQIEASDDPELAGRAHFYLTNGNRFSKGYVLGNLIDFTAKYPPDAAQGEELLRKSFEFEYDNEALNTAYGLYSVVAAFAPNDETRERADSQMKALNGDGSIGRSIAKFVFSSSPETLAANVLLMFVSGGLANLARLATMSKLEQAGIAGYKAIAIARGVGIGVETTALWTGNTAIEAMGHDLDKVFTAEHLVKTYLATAVMIVTLKSCGSLAESFGPKAAARFGLVLEGGAGLSRGGKALVWGLGHASGIGGMVASSHLNQMLGFQAAPPGGWQDGLVHDVFGYVQFAIAHQMADQVFGGKMKRIGTQQHLEIKVRETGLAAQGWAKRLGFDYPRDAAGKILRDAEGHAQPSPEQGILVGLLMEAALNRPGFSGSKLTKLFQNGRIAELNEYLKQFGIPLQFGSKGVLYLASLGKPNLSVPEAPVESDPTLEVQDEWIVDESSASGERTVSDRRAKMPAKPIFAGFFEEAALAKGPTVGTGKPSVSKLGGKAEIVTLRDTEGRTASRLQPTGATPVFIFDPKTEELFRVPTSGARLEAGYLIASEGRVELWTPEGETIPEAKAKGIYGKYLDKLLLPKKTEAAQNAIHNARLQVELLNATDQVVTKDPILSVAHYEYPNNEHNPVQTGWNYLSREVLLDNLSRTGTLADTPLVNYEVQIKGEQRLADTVSRLRLQFGESLEIVSQSALQARLTVRGKNGESLIAIQLDGEALPTVSKRQIKAILDPIDTELLLKWRPEYSLRGYYAERLLSLLGSGKEKDGRTSYGDNLAKLIRKVAQAKQPKEKARAQEALSTALAYLADFPMMRAEIELTDRAYQLTHQSYLYSAVQALRKTDLARGERAITSLNEFGATIEALKSEGSLLRAQVPGASRVPGNPQFDAYSARQKILIDSTRELEAILEWYRSSDAFSEAEAANQAREADTHVEPVMVVSDDMLLPIDESTSPDTPSAKEKTVSLKPITGSGALVLGIATWLHPEMARAAENGTSAGADSWLTPLAIGTGLLLSAGLALYLAGRKKSLPEPMPVKKPQRKLKAPPPEKTAPLEPTLKLPIPKPEPDPFQAGPVLAMALDDNQAEQARRGKLVQNQVGADYGRFAAVTDEGVGYKASNEDGFVQGGNWAIVLDGMGGYSGGDQASAIGGKAFATAMTDPQNSGDLKTALLAANVAIQEQAPEGAGAVAVAHRILPLTGGAALAEIAHVGDAGAMLFRPNTEGGYDMVFRSEDQSVVAEQRQRGVLHNTLEMRASPFAHVVNAGLGRSFQPEVAIDRIELQAGDVLLMYSDGISDNFGKTELAEVLAHADGPEAIVDQIKSLAREKMDRLTRAKEIFTAAKSDPDSRISQQSGIPEAFIELPDFPGFGISKKGHVYELASGKMVDHYKNDNLTLHAYLQGAGNPLPIDRAPTMILQLHAVQNMSGQWTLPKTAATIALGREVGEIGGVSSNLPQVSRRHAEIIANQGEYFLQDLGSTFGTQLNGIRLPKDDARVLSEGDLIVLGDVADQPGEAYQFNISADGSPILTPVLRLRAGQNELPIGKVTLRRWVEGKFTIQNLAGTDAVQVGDESIPFDPKRSYFLAKGQSVQIGTRRYFFRAE